MELKAFPGTITFLFTDIEGSTKLLQQLGDRYAKVLSSHHKILREVLGKYGGKEVDTAGDGFFITFDKAHNAITAASEIQLNLLQHKWEDEIEVKVRMGIHTGEPEVTDTGFVGLDVHRAARIAAAGNGGQVLISEATKTLVSHELPDNISIKELGEFILKDLEKPEKIFQLVIKGMPSDFPSIKSTLNRMDNLPLHQTKLIGREKEIDEVRNLLLKEQTRLVTLTGPGGTGKTSLSFKICESLTGKFSDGVYAVLLASTEDSEQAASVIAKTFHLKENPARTIEEALIEHIDKKEMLLFLDNFEQIISSAPLVSRLIDNCPYLKIIVTSRILLKIKDEFEFSVPALSLPDSKNFINTQSLSQFSAVKLFIERAKAVKKDFQVTNENAPAVAEICIQLDGLPLAIELASARIKLFTPEMMLSRLSSSLDILKSTSRSLPQRHQTLRQAIAWSYDLLPDEEKTIFRWSSIFSGGFTLEAAESIFRDIDTLQIEIADAVEALLDKSLLRRADDITGEPRFFMLETIKEFSKQLLSEEEKKLLEYAYTNYYLKLAELAGPNLSKSGMEKWLNILETEQYNLRNSIELAFESKDSENSLRFCCALQKYWIIRSGLTEGFKIISKALEINSGNPTSIFRAKALNAAGTIVHELSDFDSSLKFLEEALEIYKTLKDEIGIASVLNNISWVYTHLGDVDTAENLCNEAFALHTKLNDSHGTAVIKNNLGWIAINKGDFERAADLFAEIESLRNQLGDIRGVAFAKVNLAWMKIMLGEFDAARMLLDRAIEITEELRDKQLLSWALNFRAYYFHSLGDFNSSEYYFNKSFSMKSEIGNKWMLSFETVWLGHLKFDKADFEQAREILKSGLDLFEKNGSKWGSSLAGIFMGKVYLNEKNYVKAEEHFKKSLKLASYTKNKHFMLLCFDLLAEIALFKNKIKEAVILIAASDKLKGLTKYHYARCEEERRNKLLNALGERNSNFEPSIEIKDAVDTAMDV